MSKRSRVADVKKPNPSRWRTVYVEQSLYAALAVAAKECTVDITGFINALLVQALQLWEKAKEQHDRAGALVVTPEEAKRER